MEIKINILNLDQARKNLTNLKSNLNGSDSVSDMIILIQNSSGETYNKINEIYRSMKRIEVALAKLIETTEIVVNSTKIIANNTDTGIAKKFENTYSNYDIGVFSKNNNTFPITNNHK
jgi:hypothetical protein